MTNTISKLIFACLAIGLLAGCGAAQSPEELFAQARSDMGSGQYRSASIALKNLLRESPDNLEARLMLGRANIELGDPSAAEKELLSARDLGASADDYRPDYARSLIERGQYAEVLAEAPLDGMQDAARSDLLRAYRARALLGMRSIAEAQAEFASLLASSASTEAQRLALLGQATVAASEQRFDDALESTRLAISLDASKADARLALGQLLSRTGKSEEALVAFGAYRELHALPRVEFFLRAGEVEALIELERLDAAREAAEALVKLGFDHPVAGYLRGNVAYKQKRTKDAGEYLQAVNARYPRFQPAALMLAAVFAQTGELEQAEALLRQAVKDNPNNAQARKMLAETRLRLQRPSEALDTLRGGLEMGAEADTSMLALLARSSLATGDIDEGLSYLRQRAEAAPDNIEAQLTLAGGYLTTGKLDDAIALLDKTDASSEPEQARRRDLMLTVARQRKGGADPARAAQQLLASYPDDAVVASMAGGLLMEAGDTAQAQVQLERALQLDPNSRPALGALTRMDIDNDEPDKAIARIRGLIGKQQDNPRAQEQLYSLAASVAGRSGDAEQARQLMLEALAADPKALNPNVAMATDLMRRGDTAGAEKYARAAAAAHPTDGRARSTLGTWFMTNGQSDEALPEFQKATRADPDNYLFHYLRGRAETELRLLAQAKDSFAAAVRLNPGHVPSVRALALLEVRSNNPRRAVELADSLEKQMPGQSAPLELRGDIAQARDNLADALAAYDRAAAISPTQALTLKRFSAARALQRPAVEKILQDYLAGGPKDRAVRLLLAQEYQRIGQVGKAIQLYETMLIDEPEDIVVMNNLAWLLHERGDPASRTRALSLAGRAHDVQPDNLDIADTYGWLLFRSGDAAGGRQILEAALATSDAQASPDVAYHLAAILSEQGDREAARQLLEAALADQRPFYSRAAAEQLLRSL